VAAAVGIAVNPDLRLALGLDVPLTFFFRAQRAGRDRHAVRDRVRLLRGSRLLLGFNARVGPIFSTDANGSRFGFVTQIGIGYRM